MRVLKKPLIPPTPFSHASGEKGATRSVGGEGESA
jgi:hypothetical protein